VTSRHLETTAREKEGLSDGPKLTSAAIGEVLNHARDLVNERNGDFTQVIAWVPEDDEPLGTTVVS
jgi:hypothetical protein